MTSMNPQPPYPPPAQAKKHSPSFWILISLVIVVVMLPIALFLGCGALLTGAVLASSDDSASTYDDSYTDESATPESPASSAKPKPTYTKAQEQAIGSAKDYLDSSHFSRKGLISQLKYEGFSTKNATFAVDHISVNWNKQAAGTAEDYLDSGHYSRSGLISQLKYEGYTQSQAEYGVKKAGL